MTAATLISRNLYAIARPAASDDEVVTLAKFLVPVVMLVVVYFTITGSSTIVALLLVGYSFVTQLFPALIASLLPGSRVTWQGAFAGILVGVVVAAYLSFAHVSVGMLAPFLPQAIKDFNVGIIALALNVVAMAAVSAATRRVQVVRIP